MGSQVGARWGLATLTISTRKIWYNWTIPPNQFLGEIRNKKKIRHCGKKQIFFSFRFGIEDFERPAPFPGISDSDPKKVLHLQILLDFDFFEARDRNYRYNLLLTFFFFLRFTGNGFLSDDPMYFRFFPPDSFLSHGNGLARAKKEKNWFQILFQIEAEFEKILLNFDIFGGIMAQWLAYLLPNPIAPGSVPSIPKIILGGKNCHCSWG